MKAKLRLMGLLCHLKKLIDNPNIIVSIIIIYLLGLYTFVNAQTAKEKNQAIDLTSQGIQIGEKVPDVLITNIHNYKTKTANISDFKGKLLILDFWATWCSPCVAMIPKMDELQKEFGDKIQFLSVTSESEELVLNFFKNTLKGRYTSFPTAVENNSLKALFPHKYIPHYAWISPDGELLAITDNTQINLANIQNTLQSNVNLKRKHDYHSYIDRSKPLLINGGGGTGDNILGYSILSRYIPGLSSGTDVTRNKEGKITRILQTNVTLLDIFKITAGDKFISRNEVVLDVKYEDKLTTNLTFEDNEVMEWAKENTYCYDISVPDNQSAKIHEFIKSDLKRFFPQYTSTMEDRKAKCLVLIRTSNQNKLNTKGGESSMQFSFNSSILKNAIFTHFPFQLRIYYLQSHPLPFIDESGIKGLVDFEIEANLADVDSMNKALVKYDLKIIETERTLRQLVIRDGDKKGYY